MILDEEVISWIMNPSVDSKTESQSVKESILKKFGFRWKF